MIHIYTFVTSLIDETCYDLHICHLPYRSDNLHIYHIAYIMGEIIIDTFVTLLNNGTIYMFGLRR